MHALLLITWVALLWLEFRFLVNGYLRWALIILYLIHAVVIVVLVLRYSARRLRSMYRAT
jgi:cytochrome c oxidase subunit IV